MFSSLAKMTYFHAQHVLVVTVLCLGLRSLELLPMHVRMSIAVILVHPMFSHVGENSWV